MCLYVYWSRSENYIKRALVVARKSSRPVAVYHALAAVVVPYSDDYHGLLSLLLFCVDSQDRLEKRGLSQSLIQPIPADLRAQIQNNRRASHNGDGKVGRPNTHSRNTLIVWMQNNQILDYMACDVCRESIVTFLHRFHAFCLSDNAYKRLYRLADRPLAFAASAGVSYSGKGPLILVGVDDCLHFQLSFSSFFRK